MHPLAARSATVAFAVLNDGAAKRDEPPIGSRLARNDPYPNFKKVRVKPHDCWRSDAGGQMSLMQARRHQTRGSCTRQRTRDGSYAMDHSGAIYLMDNRAMQMLIEDAGFQLDRFETGYMRGPKALTFIYEGSARPR